MIKAFSILLILLLPLTSAHSSVEDNKMELEIKRHLENIQKAGETKWSHFIREKKVENEVKKNPDLKVRMVVN